MTNIYAIIFCGNRGRCVLIFHAQRRDKKLVFSSQDCCNKSPETNKYKSDSKRWRCRIELLLTPLHFKIQH